MKRALVIAFTVAISSTSFSQTPFSVLISDNFQDMDAYDMERDSSGNIFIVGGFPEHGTGIYLVNSMFCKVDPAGTILWGGKYSASDNSRLSDMTLTPDGGFIAIGSMEDQSPDYATLVVKIDQNGAVQWAKRIYDPTGKSIDNGNKVMALSNGKYVVFSTWNDWIGNWGLEISCFDNSGNRVWNKLINTDPPVTCGLPTGDGGFFAVGNDFELMKFDSLGGIQWSRKVNFSGPVYAYATDLIRTSDQMLLMVGQFHNGLYPNEDVGLVKMDTTGSLVWSQVVIKDGEDYTSHVFEEPDGYMIIGAAHYLSPVKDTTFFIKTNLTGNVTWMRKKNVGSYAHQAMQLQNGKYYVCGHTQPSGQTPAFFSLADSLELYSGCYSGAVARDTAYSATMLTVTKTLFADSTLDVTDSFTPIGSLYNSIDCNGVGVREPIPNHEVRIFPNPATSIFNLQSSSGLRNGRVEIFNVTGERVYLDAFTGKEKTIVNNLAPGIYVVKISDSEKLFVEKLTIRN